MAHWVVGLTGGIGSGKSAASDWFAEQGIAVVDADIVAREVVAAGQPALQQIVQRFGQAMLLPGGELNRRALREHVFADPAARQALEQITHPLIRQSIVEQLLAATTPYALLVSPLLFESQQDQLVNRTLLIDAPETLQLQRAMQRDDHDEQHIRRIMAAQWSREQRRQRADDIVCNDGTVQHLYTQLIPLHQRYLDMAKP